MHLLLKNFLVPSLRYLLKRSLSKQKKIALNLVHDDIFNLNNQFEFFFDMVFEYTCFCAIDPSRRKEYFEMVHKILNKNGLLFGIFIPLDKEQDDGPPFKVSIKQIQTLIKGKFIVMESYFSDLSIDKRKNREKVLILKKIS